MSSVKKLFIYQELECPNNVNTLHIIYTWYQKYLFYTPWDKEFMIKGVPVVLGPRVCLESRHKSKAKYFY